MPMRNIEGWRQSKEDDKEKIEQMEPHLTRLAQGYPDLKIKSLSGRDADMWFAWCCHFFLFDFKKDAETVQEDNYYYAFRELVQKGLGVCFFVCTSNSKDILTVTKLKVISKFGESDYFDADFALYLELIDRYMGYYAQIKYDRPKLFNPPLLDKEAFLLTIKKPPD